MLRFPPPEPAALDTRAVYVATNLLFGLFDELFQSVQLVIHQIIRIESENNSPISRGSIFLFLAAALFLSFTTRILYLGVRRSLAYRFLGRVFFLFRILSLQPVDVPLNILQCMITGRGKGNRNEPSGWVMALVMLLTLSHRPSSSHEVFEEAFDVATLTHVLFPIHRGSSLAYMPNISCLRILQSDQNWCMTRIYRRSHQSSHRY